MHIRSKLATFLVLVLIASSFSVTTGFTPSVELPFKDGQGNWAEYAIAEMYAKNVMTGYPDSSFRPNKPVTFLEAVVLIDRLLGYEPTSSDIESSSYLQEIFNIPQWAAGYVGFALRQELILYSELHRVSLQQPMTRQEGAMLAVRVLNLTKQAKQKKDAILPFADVDRIDQQVRGSIAIVSERGLMAGYPDNTFQPATPISRAEIAVLLCKIAGHIPYVNAPDTSGFIKSVQLRENLIIVADGEKEIRYLLPDRYLLYLNNKPAQIGQLAEGNHVRIIKATAGELVVLTALAVIPDVGTPVAMEQVNLTGETPEVQQWVELNKASENYLAGVFNNSLYFLVTRGEKMTGGYSVNIRKITSTADDKGTYYRVWVDRLDPRETFTQVLSYPLTLVRVSLPKKSAGTVTFVDGLNNTITTVELK